LANALHIETTPMHPGMDERERSSPRAIDVDPHHGLPILCHGYTVLLTNPDGTITGERQGLFDHDTRVLSRYEIFLDGVAPRVDTSGFLDAARWMARLTVARSGGDARGPLLPQDNLELTLRRRLGHGLIEDIDVTNHSVTEVKTSLVVRVDADFCGSEPAGGRRARLDSI